MGGERLRVCGWVCVRACVYVYVCVRACMWALIAWVHAGKQACDCMEAVAAPPPAPPSSSAVVRAPVLAGTAESRPSTPALLPARPTQLQGTNLRVSICYPPDMDTPGYAREGLTKVHGPYTKAQGPGPYIMAQCRTE